MQVACDLLKVGRGQRVLQGPQWYENQPKQEAAFVIQGTEGIC